MAEIASTSYILKYKAQEIKMEKEKKSDVSEVQIDDPRNFEFNLDFDERTKQFKLEVVSCGNYAEYLEGVDLNFSSNDSVEKIDIQAKKEAVQTKFENYLFNPVKDRYSFDIAPDFYDKIAKTLGDDPTEISDEIDKLLGILATQHLSSLLSSSYQHALEVKMKQEGKEKTDDVKIDEPKDFKFSLDFDDATGEFKADIVSYGNYEEYFKQ